MDTRLGVSSYLMLTLLLLHLLQIVKGACPADGGCGWKGSCVNKTCVCPTGYTLHSNKRDCTKTSCSKEDCLECDAQNSCQRCTNFLSEQSGQCLLKCNGEAKILQTGKLQGSVCTEYEEKDDKLDIIIGVVAGVSSGILLCVIVGFVFYCHLKRTRRNINLQQQKYRAGNMQLGKLKSVPVYDNKGFVSDAEPIRSNVVDRTTYLAELEKLRPQAPTLLIILNQIRRRLRAMEKTDARVPTYKGVIHQLCRVLVLLHKKDPGLSIPSDALGLLEWAQQMLEDYQMESQDHSGSEETVPSKISYIDVPEDKRNVQHHQYAIPHVNHPHSKLPVHHSQHNSTLSHHSDAGYYSSAPVPIEYHSNTLPLMQARSSTFKPDQSSSNTAKLSKKDKNYQKSKSATNVHHVMQGSDLSIGYFANGRYYDPGPQPEIYAPASSYSDRSNHVMSTFQVDRPSTHSLSSDSINSAAARDSGENGGDTDSVDNEVLPFDSKDATAPMEV